MPCRPQFTTHLMYYPQHIRGFQQNGANTVQRRGGNVHIQTLEAAIPSVPRNPNVPNGGDNPNAKLANITKDEIQIAQRKLAHPPPPPTSTSTSTCCPTTGEQYKWNLQPLSTLKWPPPPTAVFPPTGKQSHGTSSRCPV